MKYKRIFVFSLVVVAMFCVLGLFARPYPLDDHGFSVNVAQKGFLQATISNYFWANGRITNHAIVDFLTIFPLEDTYPIIPTITAILYTLASFALIAALFPTLTTFAQLSLSVFSCAMTLVFTYSLRETFYWIICAMTYFFSQSMILLATALAVRAFRGSRKSFILCIIVLFLNGTILEQPCIFQGIVAFIAMIFFALRRDKSRAFMAGAFWLTSVIAFCVMFFSPGTAARMGAENMALSWWVKSLRGLVPALSFGVINVFHLLAKPLVWSVVFFMPVIADSVKPADEKLSKSLRIWHIIAALLFIGMFMQFIKGAASGGGLPERATSFSIWTMYFTWNLFWIFFYRGKWISSDKFKSFCGKWRWAFVIVSVLVSYNFIHCIGDLRIAREYAKEWDTRHEFMIEQAAKGEKNLVVPMQTIRPELIRCWDINPFIYNRDIARYYGADELHVIPVELSGDVEAMTKLMAWSTEPLEELAERKRDTDLLWLAVYSRDSHFGGRREPATAEQLERWYRLGADAGRPECMRSLSRVMLRRNFIEALYWLARSQIAMTRL